MARRAACSTASSATVPSSRRGADRATSPTALQGWAACPFRYFLGRVLRLSDVPRPEAAEAISAIDEGSLVHEVLEEFVRDAPAPASPDAPWTHDDRVRMAEIVVRHCEEAEHRGITGRPVMWKLARRRIVRHRAALPQHRPARPRATFDVLPAADGLERAFGMDGAPPVEVDVGTEHPVRFRGRIDRVDRSPDGSRVVVYDYKTGRRRRYEAIAHDPVDGGRLLQLPVYALAARAQEGIDDATAAYWFTGESPDAAVLEVGLDDAEERFVEVVSTIVHGIAEGCFPADPGERTWDPRSQRETWSSCMFCEFDRLCPVDRGTAWERVANEDAAARYVDLRYEDDEESDEGDDE